MQYALINGIKYRVSSAIPDSIPAEIAEPYVEIILKLLQQIDDEVICKTNGITTDVRVYLLQLKHGRDALNDMASVRNGRLYAGKHKVGRLFRKKGFAITGVKKSLLKTEITGTIRTPVIFDSFALRAFAGSKAYDCALTPDGSDRRLSFKNDDMKRLYNFRVAIPSWKCRDPLDLKWVAVTGDYKTEVEPYITSSRP